MSGLVVVSFIDKTSPCYALGCCAALRLSPRTATTAWPRRGEKREKKKDQVQGEREGRGKKSALGHSFGRAEPLPSSVAIPTVTKRIQHCILAALTNISWLLVNASGNASESGVDAHDLFFFLFFFFFFFSLTARYSRTGSSTGRPELSNIMKTKHASGLENVAAPPPSVI